MSFFDKRVIYLFYLGMEIVLVSPHALDKSNKEPKNKAATNGVPAISVFLIAG